MLSSLASIATLMLSTLLMMAGFGLMSYMLPIRSLAEGWSTLTISVIATGYTFGELPIAPITGTVYIDRDRDNTLDAGHGHLLEVVVTQRRPKERSKHRSGQRCGHERTGKGTRNGTETGGLDVHLHVLVSWSFSLLLVAQLIHTPWPRRSPGAAGATHPALRAAAARRRPTTPVGK